MFNGPSYQPRLHPGTETAGFGRRLRAATRVLLVALVTAAGLSTVAAAPAAATTTPECGQSGTPAVVALADPSFYIDSSAGLDATYAGYTVRAGAAAENGLWLTLDGFTGGSVGLAPGQPGTVAQPNITAGSANTSYLLLKGAAATATPQTHTIRLSRGYPTTANTVCQRTFTYSGVYEAIKALANKVTSVTADAPSGSAHIGDLMTVTVTGNTGTLGAGPANDPGVLSYAPDALSTFPAGAWRLEQTRMSISPDGVAPPTTYTNRLYLAGASGPNRPYTAQYAFRAIGPADNPSGVQPVQYIASGTQVKHTDIGGGVVGSLPIVSRQANVQLAKSASVAVLPATGGTVKYTVTAANVGGAGATLDRIADTLPPGASYRPGTSALNGVSVAEPEVASGGSQLTWSGPMSVPAGGTVALTYDVSIPGNAGPMTNSAISYYGTAQIDASRDVTLSDPATATVTVLEAAGSARAVDDSATTNANTAVIVSVLSNDRSSGGFPLTVSAVGTPSHGTAASKPDGTIAYTPTASYAGTDTFTYTLSDGYSTATGTVSVMINPTARNDLYVTAKNTTLNASSVLANDACTGCTVSLVSGPTVGSGPAAGALTLHTDGTFTYGAPNQAQALSFVYRATATGGASATATVNISVNAAGPDQATTAYNTAVTIPVTANDTCVGGGSNCNISAGTAPSHGTANYSGVNVVYTPAAGYWGIDTFAYNLNGGAGAQVTVLVAPPATTLQTTFGVAASGTVTSSSFTGVSTFSCTGCLYSVAASPTHGTVAVTAATGALVYTPDASFAGSDSFGYTVTEPSSGLNVASTVAVAVGPDAVADTFTTPVGQSATLDVLANDSCPATCTVSLVTGTAPAGATVTLNAGNTFTFSSAPANDIGPISFQYRVTSSVAPGLSDTATATITVIGATDDTATTTPGHPVAIDVAANDPCTGCAMASVSPPTAGIATASGGIITYTPPASFSGVTTFTYNVGKNGHTTGATVTVTVLPAAVDDSYATASGRSVALDPRANDICVGCTITGATPPDGGGTAIVAADGQSISYGPGVAGGWSEHFGYTITDNQGHVASATVTIAVNAPPTASDDSATTNASTPAIIPVLANDGCTGCQADVSADAANGSVVFRTDGTAEYRPAARFSGIDRFRYVVTDPVTGLGAEAIVTLTVLPSAGDDQAATRDATAVQVEVQANDSCTGCALRITSGPAHGTATANGDGTVQYVPATGFEGTDGFRYLLTDPATNASASAGATIVVSNATADAATATAGTPVDIDVLANDGCSGCGIVSVVSPVVGSAAVVGGKVRYTPAPGFWGVDQFSYRSGRGGISSPAVVTVLVAPPASTVTVGTGMTAAGTLLGASPCAGCQFSVLTAPADGDITLDSTGSWTYSAPAGPADEVVAYRVFDPTSGRTVTSTLTLAVRPSQITVNVDVVNNDGGIATASDFALTLNGSLITPGSTATYPPAVSYTVGETLPAGYAETRITCTDSATLADAGHPFTLQGGQHVTCTVTDDDVAPTPSVTLVASADQAVDSNADGRIDAGDTITHHYVVANTGNQTLTALTVRDDEVASADIACVASGSNTISALASAASTTCSGVATISQSQIDAGTVTSTATVAASPSVSSTDQATVALPRTNGVAVAVSVTGRDDIDGSGRDSAGDVIHFHVVATNTGSTTLSAVSVGDSFSAAPTTCATVAPGATCTVDTMYAVTQADVDGGVVTDHATAGGTGPDGGNVRADGTVDAALAATGPTLAIAATVASEQDADGSGTRSTGDVIEYHVTVTNAGGRSAHNVSVADDLTAAGTTCGVVAPGATCELRTDHTITQAEAAADSVVNPVHGSASDAASVTTTIAVTVVHRDGLRIVAALDQLDLGAAGPASRVDAGDHAHFRYAVTNTGEAPLHDITLTGLLTADVACPGSSASIATLTAGAVVDCVVDHTITQADIDAGTLDATAGATGTTVDDGIVTSVAALGTTLSSQPSLLLSKTVATGTTCRGAADQVSVAQDSAVTWCFAVTNAGNVTLTGVGVVDGMLGFADGGPQPSPLGSTEVLLPGESATALVAGVVTASADVVNTASAFGRHGGASTTSEPDSATVEVTVASTPPPTTIPPTSSMPPTTVPPTTSVPPTTTPPTTTSPPTTAPPTTSVPPTTTPSTTTTPPTFEVSGVIWFDSNGNGARDTGEPALPGVRVSVQPAEATASSAHRVVAAQAAPSVLTDAAGAYHFTGLLPGNYMIVATAGTSALPSTWDSDGHADWHVAVSIQSADTSADFATTPPGSIAGHVTNIGTAAAIPDAAVVCSWAGLDGIPGTADDVVFTTTTAADGSYTEHGLPPGSVSCTASDPASGTHQTFAVAVQAGQASRADAQLGLVSGPASDPVEPVAPASAPSSQLAHSGLDPRWLLAAGAICLVVGFIVTIGGRRRESERHSCSG